VTTARRLLGTPLSSLLTWLVIGVAMALPAGLYVALGTVERLAAGWDGAARLSLYLERSLSDADGRALAATLAGDTRFTVTGYISPEQGLEEFRSLSGYGDILDSLPYNPLPAVIVLRPTAATVDAAGAPALLQELAEIPGVDRAQLDLEWVQRLQAMTRLARRGVWVLAGLLGLGVLLVTGNTIRLAIENRREEIVVVKLVGGSNAFVRRPFLYTGLWYGVGGAVVGWLMLQGSLLWLGGPVARLAGLYRSEFALAWLGAGESLLMLAFGALLGLGGAWLAVGRHLAGIEPR